MKIGVVFMPKSYGIYLYLKRKLKKRRLFKYTYLKIK